MLNLESSIKKDTIVVSAEQRKAAAVVASIVLHKGHRYWELDIKSGEIKEAQYETVTSEIGGRRVVNKLISKDMHLYTAAINKSNAAKKFSKLIKELICS